MPAARKAFRKDISCEYICFCPFIQSLFSFLFFCVFSNLKPEPFLPLSHPWFSFQSHFTGTENSTSFWVSSNLHISSFQLSSAYSLSLDFLFYLINPSSTPQITFLVPTTSCVIPTALRVVALLLLGSQPFPHLCATLPQLQIYISTCPSARLIIGSLRFEKTLKII